MSVSKMLAAARALVVDKKGVTAVEYGVIAALIIVGCVIVITLAGDKLEIIFQSIADALTVA